MPRLILAATLILAVAIMAHAFISYGRYQVEPFGDAGVVRLDRWTGSISLCTVWQGRAVSCGRVQEAGPIEAGFEASENSN